MNALSEFPLEYSSEFLTDSSFVTRVVKSREYDTTKIVLRYVSGVVRGVVMDAK